MFEREILNGDKMRQILAPLIGNITGRVASIYWSTLHLSNVAPARLCHVSSLPWSTLSGWVQLSTMPHVNVK